MMYRKFVTSLEVKFKEWEVKLEKQESINNPKIPMKLVRQGELLYSSKQQISAQTELPL